MQVKLDDEVLYEIDETMIALLNDYIVDPMPDVKRRLKWVIEHLCDEIYEIMKREWLQKFENDSTIQSVPNKRADFVNFVLARPEYKNRAEREK